MAFEASKDVEDDDSTLVERSIAGDQQAFKLLYQKHIARVYATCLRLCCDRDEAADVAQEVFVQAWEKLESFRGDSAFSTWLYRVATNRAISHIRKRKPRWAQSIDWSEAGDEDSMTTKALHLEHHLDREIAGLPEQARLVFILFAIEGYGHDEIARLLNIAVGTSKAQYHRARQLLKEKLNNE